MADDRALVAQTQERGTAPLPDLGAPSPRRGMAQLQRNQLAQGAAGPDPFRRQAFGPLLKKLGAEAPAHELLELAEPLLMDSATRQQAVHHLDAYKRAAEVLSLIGDPKLGDQVYKAVHGNLGSDLLAAQVNRVEACKEHAAFVWSQYKGLEDTVREFYPGHWTAVRASMNFEFETLGDSRWDHARVVAARRNFLDRALAMLPGIHERKRLEAEQAVHREVRPVLDPILDAHYAAGDPVHWVTVWTDVVKADSQFSHKDASIDLVKREVSSRNFQLVQATDRRAMTGLVRAERDGGVTPADHLAAYRETRAAMEPGWGGAVPDTRRAIAESSAGQNYDRLAAPLREQTKGLIETYHILAGVIGGGESHGDLAAETFEGERTATTGFASDGPPTYTSLADIPTHGGLQPATMEDVASATGGDRSRLLRDPLFRALQMTQEGGDASRRGAILIAQMADNAGAAEVGHEFYRAAFGVPQDLPEDKDELEATLNQYRPRGGEFRSAWDRWEKDHNIYREWFHLKRKTWNVVKSLTLHLALAVIAGLVSGGVGAAYELSTVSVVLMEALIFTVSARRR
jgi:hypothetical protein